MKRYALLKNDPQHGILAMIDRSFKMGWSSSEACLWDSPPFHYFRKGYFIVRIGSKNCPIKVTKGRFRNNKFIMRRP